MADSQRSGTERTQDAAAARPLGSRLTIAALAVQNRLFCHVGCKYRYAPARRAHARNWGARPRTSLWELIGWCRGSSASCFTRDGPQLASAWICRLTGRSQMKDLES
ncbi:MAG: hypothetical protein ACLQI7_25465, partial [Streptosporangiaceae bacterium]